MTTGDGVPVMLPQLLLPLPKERNVTHTSRTTFGSISCLSSSPFSSWQQTSPSRVCREHFAGSGVCTEEPEDSMAHTGGLFFVSVPLAVVLGSRTEAGASEDIERGERCVPMTKCTNIMAMTHPVNRDSDIPARCSFEVVLTSLPCYSASLHSVNNNIFFGPYLFRDRVSTRLVTVEAYFVIV